MSEMQTWRLRCSTCGVEATVEADNWPGRCRAANAAKWWLRRCGDHLETLCPVCADKATTKYTANWREELRGRART